MTHSPDLLAEIRHGEFDADLDHLLLAIEQRKTYRDQWRPFEELLHYARQIEEKRGHSLESKATLGAELAHKIRRLQAEYKDHPDHAYRDMVDGLGTMVYRTVLVVLMGVKPPAAEGMVQTPTPQREHTYYVGAAALTQLRDTLHKVTQTDDFVNDDDALSALTAAARAVLGQ